MNQIAEPFGISLPAVSRHLRVLEQAGLITRGRDAQSRPCYLNPAQLKVAVEWLDDYRQFWEQSFDRLDEHLGQRRAEVERNRTKGTAANHERKHP